MSICVLLVYRRIHSLPALLFWCVHRQARVFSLLCEVDVAGLIVVTPASRFLLVMLGSGRMRGLVALHRPFFMDSMKWVESEVTNS